VVYIIGRGFLNVIASKLIACFIYIRLKIIVTINIYFFKGVVDRKDYLYHEIKMGITVHSEPYWDVLRGFSVFINELGASGR